MALAGSAASMLEQPDTVRVNVDPAPPALLAMRVAVQPSVVKLKLGFCDALVPMVVPAEFLNVHAQLVGVFVDEPVNVTSTGGSDAVGAQVKLDTGGDTGASGGAMCALRRIKLRALTGPPSRKA